jgi:hypothetical protein
MLFEVKLHVRQRCHVFHFAFFFFDLFLPAGSIVFHEMGVRSFMKFVLHVYMLKNISREVTCQENAFY